MWRSVRGSNQILVLPLLTREGSNQNPERVPCPELTNCKVGSDKNWSKRCGSVRLSSSYIMRIYDGFTWRRDRIILMIAYGKHLIIRGHGDNEIMIG